jgi:hypothetical protein
MVDRKSDDQCHIWRWVSYSRARFLHSLEVIDDSRRTGTQNQSKSRDFQSFFAWVTAIPGIHFYSEKSLYWLDFSYFLTDLCELKSTANR